MDYGIAAAQAGLSFFYCKKGDFEKALEFGERSIVLSEKYNIPVQNCCTNIYLGYLEFERNNYDKAIEHLEKARKLYEKNKFLKEYVIFLYPYLADAYLGRFNAQRFTLNIEEEKEKIKNIRHACKKALSITKSSVTHYGAALIVIAKYYYILASKRKKQKNIFCKA